MISILSVLYSHCTKPETHAIESLTGTWRVDSILIVYLRISPLGSSTTDSVWRSSDNVGTFEFMDETMRYNYLIRNTPQKSLVNFNLHSYLENAGFTKVRKWVIILPEKTYDLYFEDQTAGSHKKAVEITLSYFPKSSGIKVGEILYLSKS